MKIKNSTKWNTQDLRSLILAGMKQFLQTDDWKYKQMLIIVTKRKYFGGYPEDALEVIKRGGDE